VKRASDSFGFDPDRMRHYFVLHLPQSASDTAAIRVVVFCQAKFPGFIM